jgi:prefoldin subunit 5
MYFTRKQIFTVIAIIVLIGIGYVLFERSGYTDSNFRARLDSLQRATDSLKQNIAMKDQQLVTLQTVDNELSNALANQKIQVNVEREKTDELVKEVTQMTNSQLVSSLNKRYPTDTLSHPLPVSEPVLINTAQDLIRYDGAKKEIVLKDSSIVTLEGRVQVKDKMIDVYKAKEEDYKQIVTNQDQQIETWQKEYEELKKQNKKLALKYKFHKAANVILLGGSAALLILK